MVCAEATGKVWGVSLGNRAVTDKSIGGDCCIQCGNCKDKHCEDGNGNNWQGVWITNKRSLRW